MAHAKMNLKQKRQLAAGAVRSEIRRHGRKVESHTAQNALEVLDDLARMEPNLVASQWYVNASDNQIRLFRAEWKRQGGTTWY